ncbi:MAG: flagellar biosynthesis protein FlhF [Chloroflexota bacterium]
MKIRTFRARTFAEALALVKRDLSEQAVILSSKERRGLHPSVEVTAAVDYDLERRAVARQRREQTSDESIECPASRTEARERQGELEMPHDAVQHLHRSLINGCEAGGNGIVAEEIKAEIQTLREAIERIAGREHDFRIPESKRQIMQYLAERSVRDDLALNICQKAQKVDDLPSLISGQVPVKDRMSGKKITMLIGPTGVGKTTTIAKLAGKAVREGKKAGIVSVDTYRIGAIEQMRIYSRIMGVPLSVVSTPGELHRSLITMAEGRDAVFVDTPGRNPSDDEYIVQLRKFCDTTVPMEVHLLMCATSDYEYMVESYKSYRRVPVDCVGFTKVDEAVRFGSLYNFLVTQGKPVAYVTTGQNVPDDIAYATSENLAQLILRKGCYRC